MGLGLALWGWGAAGGCGPAGVDDDTSPVDDDTTPADDDTTPTDDDTAPPDDDTTLGDDDTAPPDDDTAPPDDDTVPPDDDSTPPDDDTAPPDDDTAPVDGDGDGFVDGVDCDDADAGVFPGADEVCDGADQDCDGIVDEEPLDGGTWYQDGDGDGYGDAASPVVACSPPVGMVADATDCDDILATVHPGATDVCNGIDDDCDGADHCPLDGIFDLGMADARIDCEEGYLGYSMSPAGDVNGDGYGDILLGNPGDTGRGSAYLFFGPIFGTLDVGSADVRIEGVPPIGAQFGWAVAGDGDLNGDGYDDVVVSAPAYGATNVGTVYVFYGPLSGSMSADDGDAWIYIEGLAEDILGYGVALTADVTGDGIDDLWLSAPAASGASGYSMLFAGPLAGAPNQHDAVALVSPGIDDINPLLVSVAGDTALDGVGDLMYSGYQTGVQIVDGGVSGSVTGDVAFATLFPEPDVYSLTIYIAGAGDVNADGYADILIGDPNVPDVLGDEGAAYLFLGPLSGTYHFGEADAKLLGEGFDAMAGRPVAGAGDVDADGYDDFLVASPHLDIAPDSGGVTYLVYGPGPTGTHSLAEADVRFDPPPGYRWGGYSVSGAGDLNSDGYTDIMSMALSDIPPIDSSLFIVYGRPR
ncbi:hypothetical protein L6R50_13900 [Myxococcota bacterium]|nr:hypothetical protein [Myxococcota bacterium]